MQLFMKAAIPAASLKEKKMNISHEEKLEDLLWQFSERARAKLSSAMASGSVPQSYLDSDPDNQLLAKAVIDSLCRERPFAPVSPEHKADFENIHVAI